MTEGDFDEIWQQLIANKDAVARCDMDMVKTKFNEQLASMRASKQRLETENYTLLSQLSEQQQQLSYKENQILNLNTGHSQLKQQATLMQERLVNLEKLYDNMREDSQRRIEDFKLQNQQNERYFLNQMENTKYQHQTELNTLKRHSEQTHERQIVEIETLKKQNQELERVVYGLELTKQRFLSEKNEFKEKSRHLQEQNQWLIDIEKMQQQKLNELEKLLTTTQAQNRHLQMLNDDYKEQLGNHQRLLFEYKEKSLKLEYRLKQLQLGLDPTEMLE